MMDPTQFVAGSSTFVSRIPLPRPIFALLIGIDKYRTVVDIALPYRLLSCEKDAVSSREYLISIGVPEQNIRLLCGLNATRRAIIESFIEHFMQNTDIQKGDAIVFFFAGHGSREAAPPNWHSEDKKVETICPYDVVEEHGIPDYTLAALFRQLARTKGNNITAIFDCCSSGGMGRVTLKHARVYQPAHASTLPEELDHEILLQDPLLHSVIRPNHGAILGDMESFVLLAACQPHEQAGETESGGNFTTALLKTLRSWDFSTTPLTYTRLIEKLPKLDDQNPHCEGKNRVRLLFSPSDDGADDPAAFVVKSDAGQYYVEAGQIQGILKGAEFTTIPSGGCTPIVLVVESVEEFRSCVKQKEASENSQSILPHHSRARISKLNANWLKVKLTPPHHDVFSPVAEKEDSLYSLVQTGEDVEVCYEGPNSISIKRKDELLKSLPPWQQDEFTPQDLDTAAHFHFFLYHRTDSLIDVGVRLQQLVKGLNLTRPSMFLPTGANLFKSHQGGLLAGEANLQGDAYYGLTLENCSGKDLFPYVFWFDPLKYIIKEVYLPPSDLSRPLKCHEGATPLSIGYGENATKCFRFPLDANVQSETGFFKIFFSNSYVNMKYVTGRFRPLELVDLEGPTPIWGALTYKVTVRR